MLIFEKLKNKMNRIIGKQMCCAISLIDLGCSELFVCGAVQCFYQSICETLERLNWVVGKKNTIL